MLKRRINKLIVANKWNDYKLIDMAKGEKLEKWGTKILPCEEGRLACGTNGKGRLLDPEKAYQYIQTILEKENI